MKQYSVIMKLKKTPRNKTCLLFISTATIQKPLPASLNNEMKNRLFEISFALINQTYDIHVL